MFYKRAVFAAFAAAALYYQLFAPGFAGLADNGDFPRLAGLLSLCPQAGWDAYRFHHFVSTYIERPSCNWNSAIPTASHAIASSARAIFSGPVFPIQGLAAIYSLALVSLVWAWPPLPSVLRSGQHRVFNSFYLDALPLLALLAVALCARQSLRSSGMVSVVCFTAASFLLVSS